MPTSSQVAAHVEAVATAKAALQKVIASGASAATIKAAHVTYQKAVLASARTNGHQTGAFQARQSLGDDVTDGRTGDA